MAILAGMVGSWARTRPVARSLDEICYGKLLVITRNAPTTWYIDRDDRPLARNTSWPRRSPRAGVETEYVLEDTVDEMGWSRPARGTWQPPADDHARAPQVVPLRPGISTGDPAGWSAAGGPQPEDLSELAELRIEVIANSSYAELLHDLELEGYRVPDWTAVRDTTTEELLRKVWQRELACTVADSTIVAINRRCFPDTGRRRCWLSREPRRVAWVRARITGAGSWMSGRDALDGHRGCA
ncbi:MAG: hypothetical protein U5K33_01245 [Halofilum sp. (in: g-proteobacteria)]|nr:hypothetical protein [Halofilum sp. (in: g-proteobacteria)]